MKAIMSGIVREILESDGNSDAKEKILKPSLNNETFEYNNTKYKVTTKFPKELLSSSK